jgi:hypothetical protein
VGIRDALGAAARLELLLRNEYLAAENRILRGQIKGGLLLSEGEKATLAEIGQRLPKGTGGRGGNGQAGYDSGLVSELRGEQI